MNQIRPKRYCYQAVSSAAAAGAIFFDLSIQGNCSTYAGAGQAKVNRRAVVVLVYRAAISGSSFFRAVVSTLEEVTAL